MHRRILLSLALVLAAAPAVLAAPPTGSASSGAVQKALQAEYARFMHAYQKPDFAAIEKMVTPDFTWKTVDGRVMKGGEAKQLLVRQRKSVDTLTEAKVEITSVTTSGNGAVAQIREKLAGARKDKEGQKHVIGQVRTARHEWVKGPQGWKLKRVEVSKVQRTVDGKAAKPRGAAGVVKDEKPAAPGAKPGAAKPGAKPAPAAGKH